MAAPVGQEAAEIRRLAALPWVTYAEPNYIVQVFYPQERDATAGPAPQARSQAAEGVSGYPNDPFIGDQWNMRRVGAPAAWDVTTGSYSFVVAVIDSGIDRTHPEFANRLLPGRDYVNSDNDPSDDCGHGTHVAGILAAAANNAIGVAGLASTVKLLPLKVLDSSGIGTYDNIANAIERAADSNAQVINLSLGGFSSSSRLQQAVNYALARNALVVAAVGNCAQGGWQCNDQTNPDYYPAAYSGVLAVAASDHYDNWASYSGYKSYVQLAAPGGVSSDQIWSTVPGGYDFEYGTSMATPLVSAAAALVWTLTPAATYTQVADILKNTADKIGPDPYPTGRNDYFGYGRLHVAKAVRWAYPPSLTPITSVQSFTLGGPVMQQSIRLNLVNPSDQAVWWQATVTQETQWLTVNPSSGSTNFTSPDTLTLRAGPTTLSPGVYTGAVQVQSLYPQVGGFTIPVRLQIMNTVRQTFLPWIANQNTRVAWIDSLDSGQPLNLGNDSARQLLLPFPFRFYDRTYTAIWASDNGLAFFGAPDAAARYNQSGCLPTAATPNNAIYALWQDWDPNLGGQVYAHQPDDDRYVITWYQMRRTAGDQPHTFQLVIQRDGRLLLQYLTVANPIPGTVGIEYFDGTLATQVVCNSSGRAITGGDALFLHPEVPW
ncbi:MAG: hypothetical protein CVU38_02700 [Chloroflexi bacterium HGW-Chloroflexi-1]|nr:MAG: hypothetical protein CVU38_02700 [Chloroflexi bacterium HGW-Chloroflexi-1]